MPGTVRWVVYLEVSEGRGEMDLWIVNSQPIIRGSWGGERVVAVQPHHRTTSTPITETG